MRNAIRGAAAAFIAAGVFAPTAQAVTIWAIDDDPGQHLISFDSATPGTLNTAHAITGLQPNEKLIGIDFRHSTGVINQNVLYGVGSFGRIYTLNLANGAASFVSALTDATSGLPIVLNGTEFGFDFNPQADRLRIVSDLEQNLRINVDLGSNNTTVDSLLNPLDPNIVHVAYDRVDQAAGTPTTLFGIDTVANQLVMLGGVDGTPSPNGGTATAVGGTLGIDVNHMGGFDIGTNGIAYAVVGIGTSSHLVTINLGTGAASLPLVVGNAEDALIIKGMAVAIPEPAALSVLGLIGCAALARRRRRA